MRIEINNKWQFYKTYHENNYILSHDTRKEVVLKEKKESREYHLHNNTEQEIVVYRIDDGLITSNELQKCDYGIYTEKDVLYLVELKGGDYIHALKQILSSIEVLLTRPEISVKQLNARIVLSKYRTPNILPTQEKKLNILLRTKYGKGNILKKTRLLVVIL